MTARVSRWLLLLLLTLRLALGLAYSSLTPLGEAPDEADHYAYAAYIAEHGRLPVNPAMTQAKHPPLYHLLAAAAMAPFAPPDFSFLRSNPDVSVVPGVVGSGPNFFVHTRLEDWPWRDGALAMHLARLVSVAAGVVLTAAAYGLGRRLWPRRPALALAGAAFVAFLPESLFIAGAVSNDMLAAMFGALGLWAALIAAGQGVRRRLLLIAALSGLLLGLAILTKVSTVALWPVAAAALWLDATGHRRANAAREGAVPESRSRLSRDGEALLGPVMMLAVALAIAAPWLIRNWRLYGDPLGTSFMLATIDRRQTPLGMADLIWLARGWFYTFWGKFGGAGHIALPWPYYLGWAALIAAAVAGWARRALLARRAGCGLCCETRPAAQVVLWATPVMVALSILSYTRIALGTDQGRLLFPGLAVIGLILAGGLAAWVPPRHDAWLAAALAGVMGLTACAALVQGIVIPFSPPPPPPPAELAGATETLQVYGPDLVLIGYRWTGLTATQPPTGLTLYWRSQAPLADDLRVVLRVVDGDGRTLVWEKKHSPGGGRFSTDHWPPGRIVADEYRLAPEIAGRAASLEVGVQSFARGAWLPLTLPASPGPYRRLGGIIASVAGLAP